MIKNFYIKYKVMVDQPNINIQLGDIIEILSENPTLNNNKFFVKYIDSKKITIINIENNEEEILKINQNNELDESIEEIILLSRADYPGYAKQNNLIKGTWIDVYFKGDIPFIIIGKITDLVEDMIEIKTFPENEIIYIDFAYKGIPEDLPIEKIVIRTKPDSSEEQEDETIIGDAKETEKLEEDLPEFQDEFQIKDIILDADEIQIGAELEEITQIVDVAEGEQRYGIEKQTNDLLDELLSQIPNIQRTPPVMNEIHKSIERYKQLRNMYSLYDKNGNISEPKIHGENYKPIIENIVNFHKNFYWMIPIVRNKKKIYDIDLSLEEEGISDDILPLSLKDILDEEEEIMNIYKQNDVPDDENKYKYLYSSLNSYLTPFVGPEFEENNIITKFVEENINAIVNNLDDYYSSSAGSDECCPEKKRFLFQVYNTGLKYGNKKLTNNDTLTLRSFLILPKNVLLYDYVNSPIINIMQKSNLNHAFIPYSLLLNEKTFVNTNIVEKFDNSIDYSGQFLNGVQEYILDETINNNDEETLKKYVNNIIPNTTILFDIIKNNISGELTLYHVMEYLSPFMIFIDDLSKPEYDIITKYVEEKINEYKMDYAANYKTFQQKFMKKESDLPSNNLLAILQGNKELEEIIYKNYGFEREKKYSDSDILNKITKLDYGELYYSVILRLDVDLRGANIIEKFVDEYEKLSTEGEKLINDKKNVCYILTNKYNNRTMLLSSNNKEIYADEDYLSEQERKSDFKKLVKDGNYAILNNSDGTIEYYIRKKNQWVKDSKIVNESVSIQENKLFCNLQNKCIADSSEDNTCVPLKNELNELNKENLESIINEFEDTFSIEQNKMIDVIDKQIQYNINKIGLLKSLKYQELIKYNKIYNKIAAGIEVREIVESPYENLRDLILGQSDFVKKQYDIQKFAINFCRVSLDKEDPYWLYCIKTNIKLLPAFISRLANIFVSNGDYLLEIDKVCAEQGTISEDGDHWVDKYSGYIIKNIDLDTEEGFTEEGFRLKTRDIMEKDLADAVLVGESKIEKSSSPERTLIINIVKSMAQFMGINLETQYDFIVKNVMIIHDSSIPKESDYNKMIEKAAQKGKKNLPSYKDTVNSSYLILTLTYMLIAIQISIPSIKSRKTFPGCIKSFDGYPLMKNNDKSGLIYLSCIANKIKSSTEPWDSIKKINEAGIAKRIEAIIEKYVIENVSMKEMFNEKLVYLNQQNKESILLEKDIENVWINFYPPLQELSLPKFTNVSDIFKKQLVENIYAGSNLQYNQYLVLKTKSILFSLSIQEKIQKIVDKKTALVTNMANEPFLENACCDTDFIDTLKYFTDINDSILSDNTIVIDLNNIIYDLNSLARAPTFLDLRDTKLKYPVFKTGFSEETIYRAFIIYCKYNTNLVISDELREICMQSPDDFNINASIQEKIEQLKEHGLNYDQEQLNDLLNIVNYNNRVTLYLNPPVVNNIENIREILDFMSGDSFDNRFIDNEFIDKFKDMLDTFDIKQDNDNNESLREMKNYLAVKCDELSLKIIDFVKQNSKLPKQKQKNFEDCLLNITKFQQIFTNGDERIDNSVYKMILFIRDAIRNLIAVFPNIILNKVDYKSVSIPKHWQLSDRHKADVRDIIDKYYKPLYQFYGDDEYNEILEKIQSVSNSFYMLGEYTNYIASIYNNDEEISSIFDSRVTNLLFKYYFLNIINNYIELINDQSLLIEDLEDGEDEDGLKTEVEIEEEAQGVVDEFEIVRGEKKQLEVKISNLLVEYMKIICNSKSKLDLNYQSIKDKILRSKEKEKNDITEDLKNLTDEEREIQNLFKNNKLEKWSKGLQKGLTQYVKETYDEERDALEKQTLKERQLGRRSDVTDMNKDIYALDIDDNAELVEEIDNEVNNLNEYLGENDDGELDGDEFY